MLLIVIVTMITLPAVPVLPRGQLFQSSIRMCLCCLLRAVAYYDIFVAYFVQLFYLFYFSLFLIFMSLFFVAGTPAHRRRA